MEVRSLRWIGVALGWMAAAASLAFFAYVSYAIATGSVLLSARFSKASFVFSQSPGSFLLALSVYIAGGLICGWIAKTLLIDEPKWRRDKGFD